MKGRSLLLFFGLFVIAGLYLYFGVQKKQEQEALREKEEAKLVEGNPQLLTQYRLKNKEGEIVVQKQKDFWRITQPIEALASESKVQSLVKALEQFERIRDLEDTNQLRMYELDHPLAELELKTSDQLEPKTFLFGTETPSQSGTYVLLKESQDLVVGTSNLSFVKNQKLEDLREKRLLTTPGSLFSEVTIKNPSGELKFKRNETDEWVWTSHPDLPLDQDFLSKQIDKIGFIRAIEFLPKKKAPAKAPVEITVGFKENVRDVRSDESDKRPFGAFLQVFREAKDGRSASSKDGDDFTYFAKGDKTRPARVAKFHYDNFMKSLNDYVRKTFDEFKIDDVQVVTMKVSNKKTGPSTWTFVKEDEDEFFLAEGKEALNQETLLSTLDDVLQLKATNYIGQRPSADVHDLHLSFQLQDGKTWDFAYWSERNHLAVKRPDRTNYLLYRTPEQALDLKLFDRSRFLSSTNGEDSESNNEPANNNL